MFKLTNNLKRQTEGQNKPNQIHINKLNIEYINDVDNKLYFKVDSVSIGFLVIARNRKNKKEAVISHSLENDLMVISLFSLGELGKHGDEEWDILARYGENAEVAIKYTGNNKFSSRMEIEIKDNFGITPLVSKHQKFEVVPYKSGNQTFCILIINKTFKEQTYVAKSGFKINYLEEITGNKLNDKCIVSFPANNSPLKNTEKSPLHYHYTGVLRNLGTRKLWIKDGYGNYGSWFVGINGKKNHINEVCDFLNWYFIENDIDKKNVTFLGGSKGGYTALLFGFKLGVRNIIPIVPIVKLYDFTLTRPKQKEILPANITPNDVFEYNNLLLEIIKTSPFLPNVYIWTSSKDDIAEIHIPELLDTLETKKVNYKVFKNEHINIKKHDEVMKNSINEISLLLFMIITNTHINEDISFY